MPPVWKEKKILKLHISQLVQTKFNYAMILSTFYILSRNSICHKVAVCYYDWKNPPQVTEQVSSKSLRIWLNPKSISALNTTPAITF